MEQRTKRRRGTALFLALVMLVSLLPLNVLAESDDIIVQEEVESTEEGLDAEADTMESPEEGDFLMPEDASENVTVEMPSQEEGTQEPPQSEEDPEELPEELPPIEAEPEEITDEPEAEEAPPDDESAEEQPEEQPGPLSVRDALWQSDHAYVLMQGPAPLWRSADVTQGVLYEIEACNCVLLATEVVEQDAGDVVRVWLMTEEYEVLCGYVSIEVLDAYALTDEEAETLARQLWAWPVETEAGTRIVFVIEGEKAQEDMPEQEETPAWDAPNEVIVSDQWDSFLSDYADESAEAVWVAQPGDYIAVTTDTRAYLCVDETIDDEYGYDGDDYAGHFVNDAVLRVVLVVQDGWGLDWYEAEYEYGEALDNGKYLWTDVGTIFVLASETQPTDAQALTITDHAYREAPPQIALFSMSTTGMDGFSLRSCSQSTPYVYAGQTDVYATSGHDSEYPQIASLPGHGTIYATPHYINNCVVYCLEHTMPGPNANDGDGGRHPTGPYTIVDLDTYERTPGASGYIFKTETMHALAWVLRHTVPFMELARSDANNTVWSRVAGQFAMREVIKEMEGEFYVREYWIMEDFVRQAGQAPAVYLEYARWLAENGIAYGRMSGNITASGKSMQPSGSGYVATVTLTTDADRMRISRDVGELTGNSGGSDWQYYYLYSGDTISVTSASASLSFTVESLPSSDDEANFLVGIPSVEIQKVLIPQDGDPVPMKAARLSFEVPMGAVSVTKRGDSGTLLSGAVFELVNSAGAVMATQTTGGDGVTTFTNVQPGTYTVREKSAPEGYLLSANASQSVTVTAGNTAAVTFANDIIRGKIRIQKTDELTGKTLAGATFTITRLSAPHAHNGAGVGQVVATITTDENGVAETGLLDWGRYQVRETGVPQFYKDKNFSAEVSVTQSGQTMTVDVTNEPIAGWIQLTKTNRLDGTPIAGVQFDIYENDEYGNALAGTMTTDASGVATSPALRKGSYLVREHGTPTGYCADSIELSAEVRPTETTSISATNQPIQGKIRIVKTDELTGEALAGAEFTVTRVSGLPSHGGAGNAEIVAVITTDAEGIAETPLLTWGEYQVKETGVLEHFVDNRFTANVVIDKENLETYTVDVTNEPTKGWLRLVKTDRLDGTPIAGVQFDIYYADEYGDGLAATMVTGADGVAKSIPLRKGHYIVREHADPTGYVTELVELEADVRPDETTNLTATNQPIQGRIRVVKTDELTGEALAGAEFTVTCVSGLPSHNGAGNAEVVAVITTDAEGIAETPLLTWGEYQVKETGVPEHFVDNRFSVNVVIDKENLETYTVDVTNEPTKGWMRLVKTDRLDGTPLAGVQFDVYYADEYGDGLAATMVTGADGVAKSIPLRKGQYIVREHADPTGYVTELVELEADVRSDETTNLTATNQPIQGRIRIVKTDELTGEALAGAEFTVTRVSGLPSHGGAGDGEVVDVLVTDAEGIAETPLLTWGVYRVEETGVPSHFVDNHFSEEVEIKEENLKTITVDVTNEPTKGFIQLTKTDRQNGNPIEGVMFDIFYNDQYGEGLAATMVTDVDGVATSPALRKGRYIVRERGETAGYVFEEVTLPATVHSDETTALEATNRHVTVRLKLYKRDADEYDGDDPNMSEALPILLQLPEPAYIAEPVTRGDGKLTGAVFRVLAGEDILDRQGNVVYAQGDAVVDSIQTAGEDACAVTDELWPGLYEIVELAPPEGYAPSGEHFFVDARSAAQQSRMAIVTYEGLKTNRITMGAQAIVKVIGDREQDSDPKRVEKPEPGAEFEVYLRSAGSYENAREIERDWLVTDENGYAMTKPLPYGIYVLRQTKGVEGYEIKGPIEFQIDGTESLTNPPVLTLSDKPILYRLRFIKIDRETGREITLSSASFRMKDADGNTVAQKVYYPKEQEIDTFVTDDTGSVTLPETVTWGAYTVEEVKAPEGYLIRDEAVSIFVGRDGDTADEVYALDFVIEDAPVKGRIVLDKVGQQLTGFETMTDSFGNVCQRPVFEDRPLAGAVFEVRAAEDITGKDGTVWFSAGEVADTIVTTGSGMDSSRELPLGRYVLVEVDAPDGYVFSEKEYEVELTAQDDQTPVVEVHVKALNAYMLCDITMKKEKEELKTVTDGGLVRQELVNTPGEGFVFGLYSAEDIHMGDVVLMADTLVATGVTDAHGDLAFAGQFPHGEYLIRELAAPKGWKLSEKTYPVSLKPENAVANIIRAELPEAVHNELVYGTITLTKTDITGRETLPGALIEVRDAQGNVVYRAYTDEHGEIPDIPVTPGRYTFRELLAPEGYALNEAVMTFEVDERGQVTGDHVIRDDNTRVCIRKQDENGEPLSGVEFGLFAENGVQVQTALTDESGLAVFERIPYGEYDIRETKPLPGYVKNEHVQRVILDGHFVNPTEPVATFVNRHMQVRCIKVDTSGQRLAGVEFVLINANTDEIVEVVTSDEDGVFTFRRLDYGDWIIRESRAPEGFSRMEDVTLHVDEGWTEPEPITCVNIPNHYEFMKTDNRGEPLAGARFALEAEDGTFIRDDLISGEDGIVHVTGLKPGRYVIREVEPAEGFARTEETLTVTLDENYIPPKKLRRLKNYPEDYSILQTGVDFLLTPLGWAGIGSMLAGIAIWALYRTRKRRRPTGQGIRITSRAPGHESRRFCCPISGNGGFHVAVFRVEKNRNYTVMSNVHLKDRTISLKAKGLLSVILSLPEDWNYTTRGLAAICKEGVDSIGAALRELESAGYLTRHRLRDKGGRISDTEYVVYESPHREPEAEKPDTDLPDTASPCTENPYMVFPDMDAPDTENPAQLNTQLSSTQVPNTYSEKTQKSNPYPIHPHGPQWGSSPAADDDAIDAREYRLTLDSVKEQIEYDALDTPRDHERLDEIVSLITDTLCTRKSHIRIGGEDFPAEVVKSRFRKLDMYHIEYVFSRLDKKHTEVRNIRQYLLTTLYNAPATMINCIDAEVRSRGIL